MFRSQMAVPQHGESIEIFFGVSAFEGRTAKQHLDIVIGIHIIGHRRPCDAQNVRILYLWMDTESGPFPPSCPEIPAKRSARNTARNSSLRFRCRNAAAEKRKQQTRLHHFCDPATKDMRAKVVKRIRVQPVTALEGQMSQALRSDNIILGCRDLNAV